MKTDQTNDGEYEFLRYHTFRAVDNDRLMSWKAGSGRIGVGINEITFQRTDKDTKDVVLPGGRSVLVMDTEFKLGPRP
ncbi:hypothetical protein EJ07DRAFT_143366 [Lizonia empirigonia]|nr:hypothetical protein EJ07DRAFT_143366 [Lizonia empirigonia]